MQQHVEYCITGGPGKLLDYGTLTRDESFGAVIRAAIDKTNPDESLDAATFHSEPCSPDCQTGK